MLARPVHAVSNMPSCRVQPLLGLRRQTQVYQASTTDDLSPVTPLAQYSSPPAHCSYGTPQATRSTCKTITRMDINRISIVYAPFQCRSCPWIIQRLGQSTFSLQLSGSEFFSARSPDVLLAEMRHLKLNYFLLSITRLCYSPVACSTYCS